MQKNLFLKVVLLSATISLSADLISAKSCLPCVIAANSLRNLDDEPIVSMEWMVNNIIYKSNNNCPPGKKLTK